MRPAWIVASLTLALAGSKAALADDWRFCLAAAHGQHKVFVSGSFQSTTAMETLQSDFGAELERRGIAHDEVQCPRGGDRGSIAEMQQYAIGFNREMGNGIVRLDWRPAR
jgi:hypothetical protein